MDRVQTRGALERSLKLKGSPGARVPRRRSLSRRGARAHVEPCPPGAVLEPEDLSRTWSRGAPRPRGGSKGRGGVPEGALGAFEVGSAGDAAEGVGLEIEDDAGVEVVSGMARGREVDEGASDIGAQSFLLRREGDLDLRVPVEVRADGIPEDEGDVRAVGSPMRLVFLVDGRELSADVDAFFIVGELVEEMRDVLEALREAERRT